MPTFVQEAETAWNTTTSPKTTAAFDALTDDVLVAVFMAELRGGLPTISNSGTALTWTQQQVIPSGSNGAMIVAWTTVLDEDRPAQTVSVAYTAGYEFGVNVMTVRDSGGIGTTSSVFAASDVPTMSFSTSVDDSLVVVAVADWFYVDGASRVWLTALGALTELSYFRVFTKYAIYLGYHADSDSSAVARNVGLSSPTSGTQATIVAVEVVPVVIPPLPEQTDVIKLTNAR